MLLFLRALLWTVLFPGLIAGVIPWSVFGLRDAAITGVVDYVGLTLIGVGLVILLSSIVEFARRGKGTLSPVDPPTRLVVAGPYRWVRNPMYAGVLFIVVGESMVAARLGLILYGATLFAITNAFIAGYEEPYLQRVFGADYVAYKASVPRWIPRISPWRGGK